MDYFPIFLSLRDQTVLLVGSGIAIADKLLLLRRTGVRAVVLTDAPTPELLAAIDADDNVLLEYRGFTPADLEGKALVIARADDATDRLIAAAARVRALPVNIIDRPELSSFIMPALIDRSPVLVAVGTSGLSPVLAQRLRRQIDALLPLTLGRLAVFAGRWRAAVARTLPDHAQRRRFWDRWFDSPGAAAVLAGRDADGHASLVRDLAAAGRPASSIPSALAAE